MPSGDNVASYLNPIIHAFLGRRQQIQDSEQFKLEQQARKEAQAQADRHFQDTHDLEKQRLDAEVTQQQAVNKMNLAHFMAQGRQNTLENVSAGRANPTQSVDNSQIINNGGIQGGAANFPNGLISHTPLSIDPQVLNNATTATAPNSFDPSVQEQVPTPQQIGQNLQQINEPLIQEHSKAALALQEAKSKEEMQKLGYDYKKAMDVANVNNVTKKEIAHESYQKALEVAHVNGAYRIKAAMQKEGAGQADTSFLKPEIENGTYSLDDLARFGLKGSEKIKLLKSIQDDNIKFLNKDQKAFALAGGAITNFKEAMQKLNNAYQEHGITSAFSSDVRNAKQEVVAELGNIARVIGGERGAISNKDTERALGFAPNTFNALIDGDANTAKITNFNKILDNRFNTLFGNLSDAQKQKVKEQFKIPTSDSGTNSYPKMNKAGHMLDEAMSQKLGQAVYKAK